MEIKQEEIYSKVLRAGRRTYFFDVRETKASDYYLTITESKKFSNDDGTFFYKKHKTGFKWLHDNLGSNYRMTEIQAAIGVQQLKKLPSFLKARKKNFNYSKNNKKLFCSCLLFCS